MRFLRTRFQTGVAHEVTRAGIPAEDGIVVAGRTRPLGLLVVCHGVGEKIVGGEARTDPAAADFRMAQPFANNSGIVRAIVIPLQAGQNFPSGLGTYSLTELIGYGQ